MGYYLKEIQKKTEGMSRRQRLEYIGTYYWYHILGVCAAVFLVLFLAVHVLCGRKQPEFTCVMVNQEIDWKRDEALEEAFARTLGLNPRQVEMDSNFNFSYGSVRLEGANESSYEKLFFRWANRELDAVILPESCYRFCQENGGTYRDLGVFDTGDLPLYRDGDTYTGVLVEETGLAFLFASPENDPLLLVFPVEGRHETRCREFLEFVKDSGAVAERKGGSLYGREEKDKEETEICHR